jgi:hypothetical protein
MQHMERVVVKDSPIHGKGVFASRRIEPGEVIIEGCREVLSDEAVKALPAEERNFISVIDGLNILMKPPARFVNHSCNPNARGSDHCDTAIRVIEGGEEITVDYVAEQVPGLRLECNCKAPNCRGLLMVPSTPTRDIWSEWILKRRCGGDRAAMKRLMEYLGPVRDKVLAHAQLKENETLLDIGCGDGLIAFKALQNNASSQVVFSDISQENKIGLRDTAAD